MLLPLEGRQRTTAQLALWKAGIGHESAGYDDDTERELCEPAFQ